MFNKIEYNLTVLSALTFLIWFLELNVIVGLAVYLAIFIYLYINKAPISYYFIVLLFSIMSLNNTFITDKMDYIIITILFLLVLIRNIKDSYLSIGKVAIPLLIYFAYCVITIFWAPDKRLVLWGIATALEGYMAYYIITNGRFKVEKSQFILISKIASFILLTITLELLVIYFQLSFEFVFRADASAKRLVNLGWGYSNLLAVVYVFCLPIALYKYINKSQYYIIYLLIDLLGLFGLFLTQSRGAYLGAFVSILLFALFYVRLDFLKKYGSIVILLFLGTLIVPQIRDLVLEILLKFVNPQTYFNIYTDAQRFELYHLGVKKFLEHPIFGTGLKSSQYFILTELDSARYHYHNFILQTLSTLGIVGFILLLNVIKGWVKVLSRPKDPFVMIVAFTLIGSLVHQMFDISFDYYYFGIYFYGLIGLIEVYRHNSPEDHYKMEIKE